MDINKRKIYIGGSDVHHLSDSTPFSCKLRLFFDKTDPVAQEETYHLRRGKRLEFVALEYYKASSKRHHDSPLAIPEMRKLPQFIYGHVDAFQYKREDEDNTGILELKVPSRSSFLQMKKSGPSPAYLEQLQYYMHIYNCSWGTICLYEPSFDELIYWDYEYDEALGKELIQRVETFWFEHIEAKKRPERTKTEVSLSCQNCPYRERCYPASENSGRIEISDKHIGLLLEEYQQLKLTQNEYEETLAVLREEILGLLKLPGRYTLPGKYTVTYSKSSRKSFDQTTFKEFHSDLFEKYVKSSETETLTIKSIASKE